MPIGPGGLDPNGIWQYGEDDSEALASDLLNLGMASVSTAIASIPTPAPSAIGQVVYATDTTTRTTTSGSLTSANISVTITPQSSDSELLVSWCSMSYNYYAYGSSARATDQGISDGTSTFYTYRVANYADRSGSNYTGMEHLTTAQVFYTGHTAGTPITFSGLFGNSFQPGYPVSIQNNYAKGLMMVQEVFV